MQCLYEAGKHGKVQLLDIFCEAVNPDLHTQKAPNLPNEKSGTSRRFIDQVMDTIRYVDGSWFQVFGCEASDSLL